MAVELSMMRKPYLLQRGREEDLPILVPLSDGEASLLAMTRFCRHISPGSPILLVNPTLTVNTIVSLPDPSHMHGADRKMAVNVLASHIRTAIRTYDLALMPIIVVAHGAGADVAGELLLDHGNLFAAGVLLRPGRRTAERTSRSIAGLNVLLTRTGQEEDILPGQRIGQALANAGAEVIYERVLPAPKPGSGDATMARVFIGALFGP